MLLFEFPINLIITFTSNIKFNSSKATPNKKELVEELFKILKKSDCVKKFVMAHDTARIIQCLLKNASPELRTKISEVNTS